MGNSNNVRRLDRYPLTARQETILRHVFTRGTIICTHHDLLAIQQLAEVGYVIYTEMPQRRYGRVRRYRVPINLDRPDLGLPL